MIDGDTVTLLFVLHLISARNKDEIARNDRAKNISKTMQKIEEEIFPSFEFHSIVVGDFNLQPFAPGIISAHGFNATMATVKAKKISRVVGGETKYFYFNPTWKLMGDNKNVQGTYYSESDQQDLSMFWYSFDEVLLRPALIDGFRWDNFGVVEGTRSFDFIKNGRIYKELYSDHLPLKFEVE